MKLIVALMLTAVIPSNGVAQKPSIIVNGSFEDGPNPGSFTNIAGGATSIRGWVVTGEGIDYIGSLWPGSTGARSIDLDGSRPSKLTPPYAQGGVAQTFASVPGARYHVTFDLAGNPLNRPAIKPMRVSAAGQQMDFTFDLSHRGRGMGWVSKNWTFKANGTSATLEFRSLTVSPLVGWGAAIDNVRVTEELPEPPVTSEVHKEVPENQAEVQPIPIPSTPASEPGLTESAGSTGPAAEGGNSWLAPSGTQPMQNQSAGSDQRSWVQRSVVGDLFSLLSGAVPICKAKEPGAFWLAVAIGLAIGALCWYICGLHARLWNRRFRLTPVNHLLCGFAALVTVFLAVLFAGLGCTRDAARVSIARWQAQLNGDGPWAERTFAKAFNRVNGLGLEDFSKVPPPGSPNSFIPAHHSDSLQAAVETYVSQACAHFDRQHPFLTKVVWSSPGVPPEVIATEVLTWNKQSDSRDGAARAIQIAATQMDAVFDLQATRVVWRLRLALAGLFVFVQLIPFLIIGRAANRDIRPRW